MQPTQCNQVSGQSLACSFAKASHDRGSVRRSFLSVSLALSIILVLSGCVEPEKKGRFPVERTLLSNDGRELPALLLSRTDESVQVERLSDGVKLNVPIRMLSAADKEYLAGFPISRKDARKAANAPATSVVVEDRYISFREQQIVSLREEIDEMYRERGGRLDGVSKSATDIISAKEKEILRLRAEIDDYQKK